MAMIQAIYDLDEKDFADPRDYWKARRVMESMLTADERASMVTIRNQSLLRPGLTSEAQSMELQYRLAQDKLQRYWNMGEEVDPATQDAWDALTPEQQRLAQGQPRFTAFFAKRADYRRILLQRDPDMLRMLKEWYPKDVPASLLRTG